VLQWSRVCVLHCTVDSQDLACAAFNQSVCCLQLGHEREAAICLMQKYIDHDVQNQQLLIKSAIALDHLKGYLYIESEKEAYVRQVKFFVLDMSSSKGY
jgi:hypothetical protein